MATLSAIAMACGLLGPFLVLKRMTMFANSLSHTILLGIAIAFLITGRASFELFPLLLGAFFAALLSAFFTGLFLRWFRLQEDASIGLVFTSLFALGIVVVTLYMKNVHLGLETVMGNVDILQIGDLKSALYLAGLNLVVITVFYGPLKLNSFDPNLAKVLKIPSLRFILLFLTATTCISAFRAVGVLIVLAFLVGPFLTARLFSHKLKTLLFLTPLIGVVASIFGVATSRFCLSVFDLPLSTGGIVATLIGLIYVFSKWAHSVRMRTCEKRLRF